MPGIVNLHDFGCFQTQFFMAEPTADMMKRLVSVPLRDMTGSSVNRDGGLQAVNNALNVSVKSLIPNGFRLTQAYKQEWKGKGLCVGFFYTHERLNPEEKILAPEVEEALGDLWRSTWRYLHVWENRIFPGLLSVVCIDKSKRVKAERELLIKDGDLDLVEYEIGSPKKAEFHKAKKATMGEASRDLQRLRARELLKRIST